MTSTNTLKLTFLGARAEQPGVDNVHASTPAGQTATRTIHTRDRQWTYHLRADGRVAAVTHHPSGRTLELTFQPGQRGQLWQTPDGDSLTIARRRVRHGVYPANLDGRGVCEYGHR